MMEQAIEFLSTRLPSAIPGLRGRRRRRNNNNDGDQQQAADHRDDDANEPQVEERRDDPERQPQPRRRSSLENECPICYEVLFPMDALAMMDDAAAQRAPLLPPPLWLRQQQHIQRQQQQQQAQQRHVIRNQRCGHRLCSICYETLRRNAEAAQASSLACPICRCGMHHLRDETVGRTLPVAFPTLTEGRVGMYLTALGALVIPVVLEIPTEKLDWVFETGPLIVVELFAYIFAGLFMLVDPHEFSLFEKKLTATGILATMSVVYYMDWYSWVLRSICRCVVFCGLMATGCCALVGFYQGVERSLLWLQDQTSTRLKTMGVVTGGLVTYFQWWTHVVWFFIRAAMIFLGLMIAQYFSD